MCVHTLGEVDSFNNIVFFKVIAKIYSKKIVWLTFCEHAVCMLFYTTDIFRTVDNSAVTMPPPLIGGALSDAFV